MKKEHYEYIKSKYGFLHRECYNRKNYWTESDDKEELSRMFIEKYNGEWAIGTHNIYVFRGIPTAEDAARVLQHIKDTEIFFL